MNDAQLLRYSRHILLADIGIEGQQHILNSHVLIIGAGGLGCPAALYLASAGVGRITVIDHDSVELTNLQRQIAHGMNQLGVAKVQSLQQAMHRLNPEVQVTPVQARADQALLDLWLPQVDVVLDCCDNFATRQAVNRACVQHRKPLVSGAAIRFDGQWAVFDPREASSPCYACLFDPTDAPEETQCATMGVFAPLVGIIGAVQAAQALKLISLAAPAQVGQLHMLDGRAMEWTQLRIPRRAQCPVCGG